MFLSFLYNSNIVYSAPSDDGVMVMDPPKEVKCEEGCITLAFLGAAMGFSDRPTNYIPPGGG